MSDTEQISEDDARQCLDAVCAVASLHTDIIIAVPKGGGAARPASCLHLEFKGRPLVVTCEHVLEHDHDYFTNPKRLQTNMVEESRYKAASLSFLGSSPDLDLAVFDGVGVIQPESGKQTYRSNRSEWFSRDRLSPPDGTAVFLYGLLGNKTKGHQYADGLVYMQAPIYTGIGPLVEVTDNEMIGDFAEKKFLVLNDQAFPHLAGERPTGGVRDLVGTSGSGLWMILDKAPSLAAIVVGRRQSPTGTHLVRATPAWSLLAWLETLLD